MWFWQYKNDYNWFIGTVEHKQPLGYLSLLYEAATKLYQDVFELINTTCPALWLSWAWRTILGSLGGFGLTCWAGRRCYRSQSPRTGPSPAAWRASGSHRPDPEARRGECWQTPSRWQATGGQMSTFQKGFFSFFSFPAPKSRQCSSDILNYSPWAPRSCSASWCRSPEEQNNQLPRFTQQQTNFNSVYRVLLTSGIMLCTREMSLFSRRFMYRTMLVSEW